MSKKAGGARADNGMLSCVKYSNNIIAISGLVFMRDTEAVKGEKWKAVTVGEAKKRGVIDHVRCGEAANVKDFLRYINSQE